MAKVQGTCDPGFANGRDLFQSYLDSRQELGVYICVNLDGKDVKHGQDLVIPMTVRFRLGFALPVQGSMMANLPQGRVASWGGSQVVADSDRKLKIGYVMNKMEVTGIGQKEGGSGGMGNARTEASVAAIYEALGYVAR
ncbi:hypothetical protein G6011_03084 [Alternaria panax]|uniref:Uncharacterized protein n=1 Tax=Alternaria panax TaxID=48097 RepID=A0AAD4IEH9_9PLEO|nr:hypothetical protein G6011_03084 [Alternaria panax]